MQGVRYFCRSLQTALTRLCRQRTLLVLLTVLCICLPICLAPAAEALFSQGVSFSGITLAVTAPEGDPVPQLLEEILPSMQDISQYCQVKAMGRAEAEESLRQGDVTAVLVLPEGFVQGILYGENPDVELIVPADRPLEALLTLWVGQSAADMLASFQSGIYAVLELYEACPPEGVSYDQVVSQINLRYINWTLNRQDLFRTEKISVTGSLPIGLHYGLSLLSFLAMALSPVFCRIYDRKWLASQRRFLTAGRRPFGCWLASTAASWFVLFVILSISVTVTVKTGFGFVVAVCALCSLFCAAFSGLCCLITDSTPGCGVLSSLLSLGALSLAGGILPPVMLPQFLQQIMAYSPISWMRSMMAIPAGYDAQHGWLLMSVSALLLAAGFLLYRMKLLQEVNRV